MEGISDNIPRNPQTESRGRRPRIRGSGNWITNRLRRISILRLPKTTTKIRHLGRPNPQTFTNFRTTPSAGDPCCRAPLHPCLLLAGMDFISFYPCNRTHVIWIMVRSGEFIPLCGVFQLSDGFLLLCGECACCEYNYSKLLWSCISAIHASGISC